MTQSIIKGTLMGDRNPDGTFKRGWKGGPGRPPKEHSITDAINEIMELNPDLRVKLGQKVIALALEEGDMQAIKTIWSYLDGLPRASLKVEGGLTNKLLDMTNEQYDKLIKAEHARLLSEKSGTGSSD